MRETQLRCLIAVFAIASASVFQVKVHAAPIQACADDGLCGKAQPIEAQQMADVAGKFSIAGEVVGMSLQMASSWQAANGQKLAGNANLALKLPESGAGSGTPQASIQTLASATDPSLASLPGTGLVSGAKGLANVAGAAQLVQIAGDNNGASNLTSIDVSPRAILLATGANVPSAEAIAANGAKVKVDVANNAIALGLSVPGAGSAEQRLNTLGANNILQTIQIAADRQQVVNQLQLQLQVKPLAAAAMATEGVGQALNTLRGR
ncbi:hypothetical protein [Actimicrobium antarcticum]|uniref:Uncharacterized protein n=1 Tax=Actimicrobium antarcticum TaxID=1051899 RepID=A0ABP7T5X4_9BURK